MKQNVSVSVLLVTLEKTKTFFMLSLEKKKVHLLKFNLLGISIGFNVLVKRNHGTLVQRLSSTGNSIFR